METQARPVTADTKGRLLDAAERLFAERGYDATSLRDITAAAGVNLAAVHYHFGSKAGLLRAVVGRVLAPANERRAAGLDALERAGAPPAVDALLAAFVEPVYDVFDRDTERGRVLARLFGRVMGDPGAETRRIVIEEAGPVEGRYLRAFARALPGLPEEELAWRFRCLIGLLVSHQAGLLDDPAGRAGAVGQERTWLRAVLRALLDAPPAGGGGQHPAP